MAESINKKNNYYEILGIEKNASQSDIKKAYRKVFAMISYDYSLQLNSILIKIKPQERMRPLNGFQQLSQLLAMKKSEQSMTIALYMNCYKLICSCKVIMKTYLVAQILEHLDIMILELWIPKRSLECSLEVVGLDQEVYSKLLTVTCIELISQLVSPSINIENTNNLPSCSGSSLSSSLLYIFFFPFFYVDIMKLLIGTALQPM